MKKTYQIPTLKIFRVQVTHILAASLGASNHPYNESKEQLSRKSGYVWDDEEGE